MSTEPDVPDPTPRSGEQPAGPASQGDVERPAPWRGDDGSVPDEISWFDQQFANTSLPLLIVFPCCCGIFAVGVGLAGVIACRDPRARRNAILVFCLSVVWFAIAMALNVLDVLAELKR